MCKLKKAIAVMLSAVMMLTAGSMPIAVNAATVESSSAVAEQTGTYNDFSYSILLQKVTITDYTGTETEIEIPSEINGCPVTSIGKEAFSNSFVTNVIIPNTVTYIGYGAFSYSALINIEIPDSVTYIGKYAFYHSKIEKIVIPDSVTEIDMAAFCGCSNLVDVTLPNSLSTIKGAVFEGCGSLETIVIPSGVTTIENSAFRDCYKLTSVFIPESVIEMTGAAIGYYFVFRITDGLSYLDRYKIDDVKIYGYNKTAAQAYAYDNEFEFKNITLGDVDFDDELTVLDVTLLQRYCTTKVEFNNIQLKIADVDKNSSVDINDVTAIQRMIVEDYEYI